MRKLHKKNKKKKGGGRREQGQKVKIIYTSVLSSEYETEFCKHTARCI
jgi:hypothetical protein